ncbi:MAG TPA: carboxypeptidase regulatory-like domain-containing protein [Flavobacteriales bacterium]|nr:carboxypeptidase regulatory-like domain-containing protein [Flavobacteriales bacterium]
MTRLIFSFMLILLALSALADENWVLLVDGRVTSDNKKLQGAVVSLIKNTRIVQEIVTMDDGHFVFVLKPDNEYVIEVSKKGYVSKSIYFSTRNVPEEILYTLLEPEFPVEITLFRALEGLNASVLNEPVGRILYSPKLDDFAVDLDYAKKIQPELRQLSRDLKLGNKEMDKLATYKKKDKTDDLDSFADEQSVYFNNMDIAEVVISAEKNRIKDIENESGLSIITGLILLDSKRKELKEQLSGLVGRLVSIESFFEGRRKILIRIINKDAINIEYKRVTQPWGAKFYFKDGTSITEHIFQLESDVEELLKPRVLKF